MLASEEEKKVQVINEDVAKKQKACEDDLIKAEPALIAARKALDSLNKVQVFSWLNAGINNQFLPVVKTS